jgi:hypothetical protein
MGGVALREPQYYDLYTTYTEQAIRIFSAVGVHPAQGLFFAKETNH